MSWNTIFSEQLRNDQPRSQELRAAMVTLINGIKVDLYPALDVEVGEPEKIGEAIAAYLLAPSPTTRWGIVAQLKPYLTDRRIDEIIQYLDQFAISVPGVQMLWEDGVDVIWEDGVPLHWDD